MSQSRVPAGVPSGGQYAPGARAETDLDLVAEKPCGSCLGRGGRGEPCWDCQGSGLDNGGTAPNGPDPVHPVHDLAHLGIHTVTLTDGTLVAHNVNGPNVVCPVCRGDRATQANCSECAGRGKVQNIPFCDRPWDQVAPGLFLGGHDNQPGGGDARVTDQFDVVVSLHSREGYGPDEGIEHHTHTMIDGDLDPADHADVHRLADATAAALKDGRTVLVRCLAGMNRSGLVAGLALVKQGWTVDEVLTRMRAARGPYVLFNESFVAYLREQEEALRAGGAA